MISEPSIYVSFYRRHLQGEVSYSSIGGGPLTDVLTESEKPGLFVVSSVRSPAGDLWARLGTASIDSDAGTIKPRMLPPLYAEGAPGWFFWQGTAITTAAAKWIEAQGIDLPIPSVPLWIEMDAWRVIGLAPNEEIRLRLEARWTHTWPSGSVFVRFDGASSELIHAICAREASLAHDALGA